MWIMKRNKNKVIENSGLKQLLAQEDIHICKKKYPQGLRALWACRLVDSVDN